MSDRGNELAVTSARPWSLKHNSILLPKRKRRAGLARRPRDRPFLEKAHSAPNLQSKRWVGTKKGKGREFSDGACCET